MLHYAAIFLAIALAAVAVVFMLSVASGGIVYVLKIIFFIALIISLVFFILDILKRMIKPKTNQNK
jgi:uncharacterized membrane protein YtjA (UPF0391 family)